MVFFMNKSKRGVVPQEKIAKFSYSELDRATQKFSNGNIVGLGGTSAVYRGYLRDGRIVAVKRLNHRGNEPDSDANFLREIELLSRLHHRHVLSLIGYCMETRRRSRRERLLVFEYMSNGTLRDLLDGVSSHDLDWNSRVCIALGVARGLEYLHEAAEPRILHRDIKSTNILLDEKLSARITDFGMASGLESGGPSTFTSTMFTRIQGTFGYFAPEYAVVGRASLKSDVFSFGVVLLELISGRRPVMPSLPSSSSSLVMWAAPRLTKSGTVVRELADPRLGEKFSREGMLLMVDLARECVSLDPDLRPTMSEAVHLLLGLMRRVPVVKQQMSSVVTLTMHDVLSFDDDDLQKMMCSSTDDKLGKGDDDNVDLMQPQLKVVYMPSYS